MTSSQLLGLTTFAYLLSSILYIAIFVFKTEKVGIWATVVTAAAFLLQTGGIAMRWIESYQMGIGHAPLSNMYESVVFFAWAIVVFYLWVEFKYKNRLLGAFAMPFAFLGMAYASFGIDKQGQMIKPLIPALQSNWLIAHVITCFIGYAAFAVACGFGIMYLLKALDGKAEEFKIKLKWMFFSGDGRIDRLTYLYGTVILLAAHVLFTLFIILLAYLGSLGKAPASWGSFTFYLSTNTNAISVVAYCLGILFLVPHLVLKLKRVHDQNRSGHMLWLLLVPILNIVIELMLLFVPGTKGENRFGKNTGTLKTSLLDLLPDLRYIDDITHKTMLFGFLWLSVGIITGAVWANSAWGTYWSWDPKETWSLITWFIYASALHARYVRNWMGKRIAWLAIIGFFCVVFTYYGVNFLLSGLHSYGGS